MAEIPKENEAKARKLLAAMAKLERRKRAPRPMRWLLPWAIVLLLVVAIAAVILTNADKFIAIWNHLMHPDAIPGM